MADSNDYLRSQLFVLLKLQATEDKMLLLPSLLSKLWLAVVRDNAVCVQPPKIYANLRDRLKARLKIVKSQQAISHPSFANSAFLSTIVPQQHKFQKNAHLPTQSADSFLTSFSLHHLA